MQQILTHLSLRLGSVFVTVLDPSITAVPALYTVSPHKRLIRARYPNGNWETDQWGWCSTVPCLSLTCRGNVDTDPGLSCGRCGGPTAITGANAIPGGHSDSVVQWWPASDKAKPKQFTGPPGNCSGPPGNCTTYSYTMGQGGPCALWGSCDSNLANIGAISPGHFPTGRSNRSIANSPGIRVGCRCELLVRGPGQRRGGRGGS